MLPYGNGIRNFEEIILAMQFASIYFIIFFSVLLVGYYAMPAKKYQYLFILGCNLIFYISWMNSIWDLFMLGILIVITWGGVFFLERRRNSTESKAMLLFVLLLGLAPLLLFKYSHFAVSNLIAPVGISFFTFQALGYFIDVYRKKISPEKNLFRYAAFVSFFPTIVSGPINRADSLLAQMKREEGIRFSEDNLKRGLMKALYGAFIKLVIADRLAVLTDTVFGSYRAYGGLILFFAAICYTIQIYCDFSSYSLMAVGVSEMLGYHVVENFKAPYFAESIQEFWRRWHISLSTWFRDYVYISMGGNRCSGVRRNLNLFVTFLVSGLWHGANWTFVFWGGLHGIYQIVGNVTKPFRCAWIKRLGIREDCFSFRFGKRLLVFLCVAFAWIFFRMDTITDAFIYIGRMFTRPEIWDLFQGEIYLLGLNKLQMDILGPAFFLFLAVDYMKYKKEIDIDEFLLRQNFPFRCLFITGMFLYTFVFGMYGPEFNAQDFIYFHF